MAVFCTNCGAALKDYMKFCTSCGTPVKPVQQPAEYEIHPRQWTPEAETARLEAALQEAEAALDEVQVPEEQIVAVKQPEKKRTVRKISTAVISVLLCILMAISMMSAVLVFDIRALADQEKLYQILSRVDLSHIPANDLLGDVASDTDSLDQYICDSINGSVDRAIYSWEDIKPKTIRLLLTDTNLLEVVSQKGEEFLQDIYTGHSYAEIEVSEVEAFLYQNRMILNETFSLVTFDQEGCTALAQLAEENVDFSVISVDYVKSKMPGVYTALRVVSSPLMLIGLAVIAVLLMVMVIVLNRRTVRFGIRDCAMSMAIVNGLLLLTTGITCLLPMMMAGTNGLGYLITLVLNEVLLSSLWISVAMLGVGVIALLVCLIIRVISEKK